MNWYFKVLRKYSAFGGRAGRSEFWVFAGISILITIALAVLDRISGIISPGNPFGISTLYSLGVLIPSLAVGVRRLHDTGKSGLWWLLALVPVGGAIALIAFWLVDGQRGDNQYGPDPRTT